jgi:signal transduction histidine kinase
MSEQARNFIDKIVDWFIPAELKAEREKRQLARMFLISHICGPFLGNVVPGALYFLDPHPAYAVAVLAASITGFWLFPFLLRAFGRYNLLCFISVQNLIFCILWSCYFYGGVASPTLPWVLTIPLLTFCYLGPNKRLHLLAFVQFSVNVAAFVAFYRFAPKLVSATPIQGLQGLGLVSTVAALAYVAMMALYYRRILASGAELEGEMRGHMATAAELRRATVEAERASAAKAEFVASMSHELRAPLNAVIGYSELLMEEAAYEDDAQSTDDLQKIHHAGQHLLKLVNEVLDLSKIEAGRMELALDEVLVGELIAGLVERERPRAEAKGIWLRLELGDGLGAAAWDAQRVGQAIAQVLDNAVKFTSEGGVTVKVRRAGGEADGMVVVDVEDTGVGIAPKMLPQLFEKFAVADDASASKYGDAGLGLSLSRALCRLMGGEISVRSQLGQGSCFKLHLPCRRTDPASMVASEAPEASAGRPGPELAAA